MVAQKAWLRYTLRSVTVMVMAVRRYLSGATVVGEPMLGLGWVLLHGGCTASAGITLSPANQESWLIRFRGSGRPWAGMLVRAPE